MAVKILLAINLENLESYIGTIRSFEICDIIRDKKTLLEKVKLHNPDIVMLSHTLPGVEDIKVIVDKLSGSDYFVNRIIYLYGEDNEDRLRFISHLVSRGIYDYYVGTTIDANVVNSLLFNKKTRSDVKNDIISFSSENQGLKTPENQAESTKIKFIHQYVESLSHEEKEKLGLIKEKIIVKSTSIGSVIIAVAGAQRCVGCTHVAISIANFLAEKKFKVALFDLSEKRDTEKLNINSSSLKDKGFFKLKGIDFYNLSDSLLQEVIGLNDYNFIILDIGKIKNDRTDNNGEKFEYSKYYSEMLRSDISILVCNSKPWQINSVEDSLFGDNDSKNMSHSQNWLLFFNFTDEEVLCQLKYELDGFKIFNMPYIPELFKSYGEMDLLLDNALSNVLPAPEDLKRKSLFGIFNTK